MKQPRKILSRILILILCLLILSICFFLQSRFRKSTLRQEITEYLEKNNVLVALETGDIICRNGNGIWSEMSREQSTRDRRYTHAGIILIQGEGDVHVIHAEANDYTGIGKVEEIPLVDYLLGGDEAEVYRLRQRHPDLDKPTSFIFKARAYLGTPFDYMFDINDASRMYCTEYVYKVFKDLEPAIELSTKEKNNKTFVPVDSCNDPALFKEVISLPNFHNYQLK